MTDGPIRVKDHVFAAGDAMVASFERLVLPRLIEEERFDGGAVPLVEGAMAEAGRVQAEREASRS